MITREADYAIRAMTYLAARGPGGAASASMTEVAAAMEIPYRFLRKLVRRLVAEKLVLSRRGKGGGLCLARPAKAIALLDVIRAVGPAGTQLSPCLSRPAACGRSRVCRVHAELQRIQGDIDRRLAAITLAQLRVEAGVTSC